MSDSISSNRLISSAWEESTTTNQIWGDQLKGTCQEERLSRSKK
jgi:hypothetical protein